MSIFSYYEEGVSDWRNKRSRGDRFSGNTFGYEGFNYLRNTADFTMDPYAGFDEDWMAGQREKMAMFSANRLQLDRKQAYNDMLRGFQDDTSEFMRRHADAQIAQASMESEFQRQDLAISDVLAGLEKGASRATSRRQYMQMAQSAMRDTQAALNKVSNFRMPELRDLPTTFTDPFSGRTIDMSTKFSDIYNEEDPAAVARQSVMSRFEDTRSSVINDIYSSIADKYGDMDRIKAAKAGDFASLYSQYQAANDQGSGWGGSLMWSANQSTRDRLRKEMKDLTGYDIYGSQADRLALGAIQSAMGELEGAEAYADAASMAALAGNADWVSYKNSGGKTVYFNPLEQYLNSDINAELEKIIGFTESKFNVDFRKEGFSFKQEFENRRDRAIGEIESAKRNQELNDLRAGQMEQQKRQLQQRLERQQQEYQSTLASFGTSMGDGEGVVFTDTRPS